MNTTSLFAVTWYLNARAKSDTAKYSELDGLHQLTQKILHDHRLTRCEEKQVSNCVKAHEIWYKLNMQRARRGALKDNVVLLSKHRAQIQFKRAASK